MPLKLARLETNKFFAYFFSKKVSYSSLPNFLLRNLMPSNTGTTAAARPNAMESSPKLMGASPNRLERNGIYMTERVSSAVRIKEPSSQWFLVLRVKMEFLRYLMQIAWNIWVKLVVRKAIVIPLICMISLISMPLNSSSS